MIPKEKAEELVKKFLNGDFNEFEYTWISDNGAKKCALITVEEILKVSMDNLYSEKYWQEVKKEIEKL